MSEERQINPEINPKLSNNDQAKKEKHKNALKWILVVGIVIVLNLFFSVTIKLFYDSPEFSDFCGDTKFNTAIETQEQCNEIGGKWTEENFPRRQIEEPITIQKNTYCDANYTCRQEYDDARSLYNRNVFVVMVILGVISITAGIFISVSSVSLGLSLGGVLSLVIGSMGYWSNMNDLLRVIVMAIALVALIWVGIKKLRD